MSSHEAIIRYDGPALAGHKMDVEDISPALLALADLCKLVNEGANDKRASVRLYIDLDVEQHCAQFKLQVVQTFLEHAKSFLDDDHVVTAGRILTILGVAGSTASGFAIGLFKLIRLLRGRKPDAIKMVVKDGQNVAQISVGRDAYFVHPEAARLLANPVAMRKAKEVTKPATKDGYEKVEFEDGGTVVDSINKEEAILIDSLPQIEDQNRTKIVIPESRIRAMVRIRKATYVGDGRWYMQYDKAREMAISDKEWLSDFQSNKISAPPGSLLDVDIVVSEIHLDGTGNPIEEPTYTISKVYGVKLPEASQDMFSD